MNTGQEIEWAGGKHVFNLNTPRIRMMLSVMGLPGHGGNTPAACVRRFEEGTYELSDVERIIQFGLLGGGMAPRDVNDLLDMHVRSAPLTPNAALAAKILIHLFMGDTVGTAA